MTYIIVLITLSSCIVLMIWTLQRHLEDHQHEAEEFAKEARRELFRAHVSSRVLRNPTKGLLPPRDASNRGRRTTRR